MLKKVTYLFSVKHFGVDGMKILAGISLRSENNDVLLAKLWNYSSLLPDSKLINLTTNMSRVTQMTTSKYANGSYVSELELWAQHNYEKQYHQQNCDIEIHATFDCCAMEHPQVANYHA